jgi:hypothetical protein
MLKRLRHVTLLATAMLLLAAGAFASTTIDDGVVDSGKEIHALAHHQHGGAAGHIDVDNYGVELVGQIDLSNVAEGKIADVGVHEGYAYLGSFRQDTCGGPENVVDGGVYIVDINDPANPVEVAFIPGHQDSFVGEGVQAIDLTTSSFNGDILVLNAEGCGKNTKGGFTIYDVTDPRRPKALVQNYGDFNVGVGTNGNDANDIHSAFAWDAGDKAYVVVVDDFETTDVDIFDITNPRKPKLVGEYDLDAYFTGAQDINDDLGTGGSFLHDMVVKNISGKWLMLLSYWDGGYVVADVSNPAAITYVADSDFPDEDALAAERGLPGRTPEGNAHQAEFTVNNEYIIGADEDFSPFALVGENTSEGGGFDLTSGSDTPQLADGTTVSGATVYVGLACTGGPAVPAGSGSQIALVERGVCTFTEKLANVEAAGGYVAAIVFNRQGGDGCSDLLNMSVVGNIPAFFVGRDVGLGLLDLPHNEGACRLGTDSATAALIGAIGDSVGVSSQFDGWGYVHLYQNGTGKLTELDQYAIPEAHDPSKASGYGDLSVHEVATSHQDASLAYLSYYSGGFRVIRIVNDEIVEVGAYIADGGNNFWGVEVFSHNGRELVAASDRDSGLWIFEYTGTD